MSQLALSPPAPGKPSMRAVTPVLRLTPFIVFSVLFLLVPMAFIVYRTFTTSDGQFTLATISILFTDPSIQRYYYNSIKLSLISAVLGAFFGFLIAYAVVLGGLPGWIRGATTTFAGVAANFAGVPLAFAFTATLGRIGFVSRFFRDTLGWDIYAHGFNLISVPGLMVVYLYFQIPLMVLVITPALDGLKREWREACSILGGTSWHYWMKIALPILWPSILGATLLLFANAFGAVATAYALSTIFQIIPIQLFAQMSGDALNNPGLGYAIAFGMVVVTCLTSGGYIWLRSRAERGTR